MGRVSQWAKAFLKAGWLLVSPSPFPPYAVSSSCGRAESAVELSPSSDLSGGGAVSLTAAAAACTACLSAEEMAGGAQAPRGLWWKSCAKMTRALR